MKLAISIDMPDPAARLPTDIAERATRILDQAILGCRTLQAPSDERRKQVWGGAAAGILHVLAAPLLNKEQSGIESLHRALAIEVQRAFDFVLRGYQIAARESMDHDTMEAVERRICSEADEIENGWLENRLNRPASVAEYTQQPSIEGAATTTDPIMLDDRFRPRHPKAPDKPMARHIEAFKQRIEADGSREVRVKDMVRYYRYSDVRGLQKVQAEDPKASPTVKRNVMDMLTCPSAKAFWERVDRNTKGRSNQVTT